MISFDENSFIYDRIIFVRDPHGYVNLSEFVDGNNKGNSKGKVKDDETVESVLGNDNDNGTTNDELTEIMNGIDGGNSNVRKRDDKGRFVSRNQSVNETNNRSVSNSVSETHSQSRNQSVSVPVNETHSRDDKGRFVSRNQSVSNSINESHSQSRNQYINETHSRDDKGRFTSHSQPINEILIGSDVSTDEYIPSAEDDALVDAEQEIPKEYQTLRTQITISNPQLMLSATPIWKMNKTVYGSIYNDFEHYKDATFAISFNNKIPDELSSMNVEHLFKTNSIDSSKLHKFTVSDMYVPTEDPIIYDADPVIDSNSIPQTIDSQFADDDTNETESKLSGGKLSETKSVTDKLSSKPLEKLPPPFKDVPMRKIPLITFPNITIFRSMTHLELKQIIAFQLNLNVTNVVFRIRDSSNIIFPHTKIVNESKYKWVHVMQSTAIRNELYNQGSMNSVDEVFSNNSSRESFATNSIYAVTELSDKTVSIGNNPIIVTIFKNKDSRSNIYEELFYPNYLTTAVYYKRVIDHGVKDKLNKIPFRLNISQLTVQLIYKGPATAHSNLNIVKLFNINHVNEKCSKIYIQSKVLDDYNMNVRQMQYIKSFKESTNQFKGIDSLYNTCSFYISEHIYDRETKQNTGIIMHHVDISENMNITFVFTNTSIKNTYEYIADKAIQYIANNGEVLLKHIRLSETIYNTEYSFVYYVPVISNVSASFTITGATSSDLSGLSEIMSQEIPQTKFSTRSSIYFSSYSFYSLCYWYNMLYLSSAHEFLTTSIIYKDIFPNIHCILNDETGEMTVTLNKMSSMDCLIFSASLIIGSIKKPGSHFEDDIDYANDGEVSVEAIRKMASKYDKKLLKLLTRIDPTLFGPRYIGTKNRSYSGLCQKKEQRPVPLTEFEYEELLKKPELQQSLTKLQNQTYPEQTICLFCADKEYKFLNYHHFPNQKCIVRCTSKSSNKTQYDYCTKELGAQNTVTITNKYENQTITLYNALITKGRKCRIPEEIRDVLSGYVLLKLNIDNQHIDNYCIETWGKHAFVIQRSIDKHENYYVCNRYFIKTDYSPDFEYVLILQSEGDDGYFVFITEGNNPKPLDFEKYDSIKEFFVTHVRQTNDNNNFIRFLEKALGDNLGDYAKLSMKDVIKRLKTDKGLSYFISEGFIYGVLRGNTVYLTPKLYWYFDDADIKTYDLSEMGTNMKNNTYEGPDVITLKNNLISTLYMDYTTQTIRMIVYNGHPIFVKPFEMTAKYSNIDVIQFDYYAFLNVLINTGKMKIAFSNKDKDIQNYEISNVINMYVYIYLMTNATIDKRSFFRYLAKIKAITNKPTHTHYCDKETKNFISWRNSKINKERALKYINQSISFNTNELIAINYGLLKREMNFCKTNEEEIFSKIITS